MDMKYYSDLYSSLNQHEIEFQKIGDEDLQIFIAVNPNILETEISLATFRKACFSDGVEEAESTFIDGKEYKVLSKKDLFVEWMSKDKRTTDVQNNITEAKKILKNSLHEEKLFKKYKDSMNKLSCSSVVYASDDEDDGVLELLWKVEDQFFYYCAWY